MARVSPVRMLVALPNVQSNRVRFTISMMVRTPLPSSPTNHAVASSYSTSLEALAWLPSLSLRRCRNIRLRVPSGRTRGRKKQLTPPGARASTRNTSPMGAEVNHLCPRNE